MAIPKAGIFGIEGLTLSDDEKRFFTKLNPLGFILFARNCESPEQINALTTELKKLFKRNDVLILIDQEGGRVARLKPPHWRKVPPAGYFASIADGSISDAQRAVYANARLIARELYELGINVDCAPLADVPVPSAHDIIGDRAYGDDPYQVSILAEAMARGLLDGGILPVLKHIPGHGRANSDSHEELPVVYETLATMKNTDFVPFKALSYLPLGMTAHILYTAIDENLPATLSPTVITLIRDQLGFDGLLMSDDLSMKALRGHIGDLAKMSIDAGCDIILHCNGKMSEMELIAETLPLMNDIALKRLRNAIMQLKPPTEFDYESAEKMISA